MVLLNLLIAIMGSSHTTIGNDAALVARYQRARLIVRLEKSVQWTPQLSSKIFGTLMRTSRYIFLPPIREPICPKWLHVLTPTTNEIDEKRTYSSDHLVGLTGASSSTEARLDALQRAVEEVFRRVDQLPKDIVEANGAIAASGYEESNEDSR